MSSKVSLVTRLLAATGLFMVASGPALAATAGRAHPTGPVATRAAEAGAGRSGSFRALTYNVAGLPVGLSSSEPDINTPYISPLLNNYDLVLVQEDWANPDPPLPGVTVFHEVLISQVTFPYLSTPEPVPLGTDPVRPTALVSDGLNRMSNLPFGPVTRVMWPNCFGGIDTSDHGAGDCLSQKGFSVATTELAPGVAVDVYNLHGEAGSGALDPQYRAEGYALLGDYIHDHSAGRAVIVGGDFNLHVDRPADKEVYDDLISAASLIDTCDVTACGAGGTVIDKFLYRNGGGVTLTPTLHQFEGDLFVRPTDGAPLSDHVPLRVDFAWATAGDGPPDTSSTEPPATVTTLAPTTAVPTTAAPTTATPTTAGPAGPAPSTAPSPHSPAGARPAGGSEPPPPSAAMPRTGAAITARLAWGAALTAAGSALVLVARRRRAHEI